MSESQQAKLSSASERLSQNNKSSKNKTNIADSDLNYNDQATGYENNSNLNIKKEECNNNNNGLAESNYNNYSELLNHELINS